MSDYENYQEASGWLDPMAIPLGMYGKRLQFIIFDKDGNRETVLTGKLLGVESECSTERNFEREVLRASFGHEVTLNVPGVGGDVTLPLQGKILWKEIP